MHVHRQYLKLHDCTRMRRDTTVGVCIKRWKHCGRCRATECKTPSSKVDMCYGSAFEEVVYDGQRSELVMSFFER